MNDGRANRLAVLLSVLALVVAVSGTGGPALAAAVRQALNSDKVDGRHAVGADATPAERRGKLVATDPTTGRLPNGIISKAPNADKVDGVDARDLLRASTVTMSQSGGFVHRTSGSGEVVTEAHVQLLDGADVYYLPLTSPNSIGAQRYHLADLEICYNAVDAQSYLDQVAVAWTSTYDHPEQEYTWTGDHSTVAPAVDCFTLEVGDRSASERSAYSLKLHTIGSVRIIRVTSTFRTY